MLEREPVVTVVVPAYNAEATLDMTLNSIRGQTYPHLEIIVVVDGATDGTEALVRRHMAKDPRIRVIVTENQGLVPARNTGARAGTGAFIAPVDADDIWHPEKIRKQLAVFAEGGEEVGLVYTLFRRIDQWGFLIRDGALTPWSGDLFCASLLYNCVGNGSSIMVRRQAFEQVGGYAMALNRVGCEDYLLQILISHDWRLGVVPEYLTGYRFDQNSMSRNYTRMAMAREKMLGIVAERHPDAPPQILRLARAHAAAELALAEARIWHLRAALVAFSRAVRLCPLPSVTYLFYRLRDLCYRLLRTAHVRLRRGPPPRFEEIDPRARQGIAYRPLRARVLQRLLRQTSA